MASRLSKEWSHWSGFSFTVAEKVDVKKSSMTQVGNVLFCDHALSINDLA